MGSVSQTMGRERTPASRDSSPSQLINNGDSSRTSSSASTYITSYTRESTPEFRLECISISPLPNSPEKSEVIPTKIPISACSPLLSQPCLDETTKKLKIFNKSLRRARSFRAGREKIQKKSSEPPASLSGQEVTFLISKSLSGRIGWKIMPEDETIQLQGLHCLEQVMERIRDLQFTGEVIPQKLTMLIE